MKVQMRPYGKPRPIPTVPALVQSFIDGQFSQNCPGFATKVDTDSCDTGHGMDYLNRLTVTKEGAVIYDSGMIKWRDGMPCSTDHPEYCFRKVGLKLDGDTLLLGIEGGDDTISVYELRDGRRSYKESCNMDEVRRTTEAAKIVPNDMASLRKFFETNDANPDYEWVIGSADFQTDLGLGFMVYHNGHTTDTVWDFCQVLVIHEGKPFISDRVWTGLQWAGKFTNCGLTERKVNGNHFDVTFWCAYHKNRGGNPKTVSFDLELP